MPNEAPLETLEGRQVEESCSGVSLIREEHTRAAAVGSVCLNWTETGPGPTAPVFFFFVDFDGRTDPELLRHHGSVPFRLLLLNWISARALYPAHLQLFREKYEFSLSQSNQFIIRVKTLYLHF